MTEISFPTIPRGLMYINGVMTKEWQDFFRDLFVVVDSGVDIDDISNGLFTDTFSIPTSSHKKKLDELLINLVYLDNQQKKVSSKKEDYIKSVLNKEPERKSLNAEDVYKLATILHDPVKHNFDIVLDDQQINLGIVRTGSSAPIWTNYKGGQILAFDKAQDNSINFNVQLTHRYQIGTAIEFHIHSTVPDNTAGVVRWNLTYSWADIDGTFPAETTLTTEQTVVINSLDSHLVFDLEELTGSSSGVSSMLICSLTREGTHANDTYDNDIYLIEVDFHLKLDSLGSRQELSK